MIRRRLVGVCLTATLLTQPAHAQETAPNLADRIVWAVTYSSFFACVRNHESGNVPPLYMDGQRAQNPTSTSSGHYQFIDSTWRTVWLKYAHRQPPTPKARQASSYDQSLAAGLTFIHSGKSAWNGTGC